MSYQIADFIPLEIRQQIAQQTYTLRHDGDDPDAPEHLADEQGYCPLGAACAALYGTDDFRPDEGEVADYFMFERVGAESITKPLESWSPEDQDAWQDVQLAALEFIKDWDAGAIKDLPAAMGISESGEDDR